MHRGFIARERHHRAAGLQRLQNLQPIGRKRACLQRLIVFAQMGRDHGTFRQLQRLGGIAGAQPRAPLFGKLRANGFSTGGLRVDRLVLVHLGSPCLKNP
ncbi:hypothetical protein SDC9_92339 [bioreactor metagenome]|uniref:Uncharacterized protein n=1 Tax=bioreactor metagenome TaxID=1076179 RepID=A0A644ZXF6_9ZZZZ